jgi:hypothetical protein
MEQVIAVYTLTNLAYMAYISFRHLKVKKRLDLITDSINQCSKKMHELEVDAIDAPESPWEVLSNHSFDNVKLPDGLTNLHMGIVSTTASTKSTSLPG